MKTNKKRKKKKWRKSCLRTKLSFFYALQGLEAARTYIPQFNV
jgi:hypothetical protein